MKKPTGICTRAPTIDATTPTPKNSQSSYLYSRTFPSTAALIYLTPTPPTLDSSISINRSPSTREATRQLGSGCAPPGSR